MPIDCGCKQQSAIGELARSTSVTRRARTLGVCYRMERAGERSRTAVTFERITLRIRADPVGERFGSEKRACVRGIRALLTP
jgi:hypothetical protein